MSNLAPDPEVSVARSENGEALDVFVEATPGSTGEDARGQFVSMAERAARALREQGLGPGRIVSGWVRFASAPTWDWRAALAELWQMPSPLPITAIVQRPAEPFHACILSLHAVRSPGQPLVWHGPTASPAAATVMRDGARHLRLMSVTPRAELAKTSSFAEIAYDMFSRAGHALTTRGLSFADVVRTWIHVQDIEANYAALNQARSRFFEEQGLLRLPASTCVEGIPVGVDAPVSMDLSRCPPILTCGWRRRSRARWVKLPRTVRPFLGRLVFTSPVANGSSSRVPPASTRKARWSQRET
jgi:hypothetical protein